MRNRSHAVEILDDPAVPDEVRARCYHDLRRTHRWLGNTAAILRCLRRDPLPVRRVLDIGCGSGALLEEIRDSLGIEGIGIDLRPVCSSSVPMLRLDAVHEPLPEADVAIAVVMAHHLTEDDLVRLIQNVGRSCRRFLILDLVRHPLPAALFRVFVSPLVHRINGHDGLRSLQRAFTPAELKAVVARALSGTGEHFRHSVAPFSIRQMVDISYAPVSQD